MTAALHPHSLLAGALALTVFSVSCKKAEDGVKEQSFKDAIALMCSAPDRVGDAQPDQKAAKLSAELSKGVTNTEALEVFKAIGLDKTAADKKKRLEDAAKKAGVASCATAEVWAGAATPVAAGPGTTSEHGTGQGAGEGPGEKAGAAGNKDGTPGGASKEHGSGTGGGAGPGEKAGAAGNKDGKPGGATEEHGSGTGGGAGRKGGDKDGKKGDDKKGDDKKGDDKKGGW